MLLIYDGVYGCYSMFKMTLLMSSDTITNKYCDKYVIDIFVKNHVYVFFHKYFC